MRFILILVFSFSSVSKAQSSGTTYSDRSCTDVDLRKELGPVRDQGDRGWCYAYTLADLLTQRDFKKKKSSAVRQVSAADIANTYHRNGGKLMDLWGPSNVDLGIRNKWLANRHNEVETSRLQLTKEQLTEKETNLYAHKNGGFIALAFQTTRDRGLCYEDQLDSEQYSSTNKLLTEYKKRCPPELANDTEKLKAVFGRALSDAFEQSCSQRSPASDVTIETYSAELLLKRRERNGQFTFYGRVSENSPLVDASESARGAIMSSIDIALTEGRAVSIGYNPEVLTGRPEREHVMHASTIAGRRKIRGQCEYLVRNSWGTDCSRYMWPCDGGNIWVPGSELEKYITDVHSVR